MSIDICSKCGKEFKISDLIIDCELCICESCYNIVQDKKTKCSNCKYLKLEDSISSDYPVCSNKYSFYFAETEYFIDLNLDCKHYDKNNI